MKNLLRKVLKKATFWFLIMGVLIIWNNVSGNDFKNILLIGLNPFLNLLVYTEKFRAILWNEGPTTIMYIVSLIINVFYGVIIDISIYLLKIVIEGFKIIIKTKEDIEK